ncbi:MAG: DUF3459 domain-containing protein [Clostridium sp.]|jgi:glycosidase|nr:DUF3459 domain-containing protein [Clostridium sp.]
MKRKITGTLSAVLLCLVLAACQGAADGGTAEGLEETQGQAAPEQGGSAESLMRGYHRETRIPDDRYRTFYEVFVYSFFDGDGDGIGDLKGLTRKLDYISGGEGSVQDGLGCNGIWLMPIMPSPTYHKYDVVDYLDIDPQYGSMEDFEAFMEACRERDVHVLIDLVLNHTSSGHEWFRSACDYLRRIGGQEPDPAQCPYVEYYHFSKEKASGHYPVEGTDWYYEGSFWSEMPDLNLQSEAVRAEFEKITQFWLDKGVAGFRIDAAKEFVSDHTAQNVEILSWLDAAVASQREDAYLVAEVWTDIDTYQKYYASGIDSVFNFAFAQQGGIIASALNRASGEGAVSYGKAAAALEGRFGAFQPDYVDAPFYTNHDTARSAGYYSGEGGTEKTKLAQALNLMMTGNVFLYYGEELGMKGAGKDENKRAPMFWQEDPDGAGMCEGPADMDSVKMKYPSLEAQKADGNSIFWFVKEAIRLRNTYPAIARGSVACLEEWSDEAVCVLRKEYRGEELLLLWNLGAERVRLDLGEVPLGGASVAEGVVAGALLTGTEDVAKDGGQIVLPPYSMAVLKGAE